MTEERLCKACREKLCPYCDEDRLVFRMTEKLDFWSRLKCLFRYKYLMHYSFKDDSMPGNIRLWIERTNKLTPNIDKEMKTND